MKSKKTPMRRCAGCMEQKPKTELIRLAGYEGQVSVDLTGRANGRGVYLCPAMECLAKAAKKKAISRRFDFDVTKERMDELMEELLGITNENFSNNIAKEIDEAQASEGEVSKCL